MLIFMCFSTVVSLDETSYFANYEATLKAKIEAIMVVSSGSKAFYRSTSQLEQLMARYSPIQNSNKAELDSLPPCWVDIQYPTVETMVLISRAFGIHTLTMEDCLSETEDQHQKNELFDTYRFISFSEFHYIPFTNVLGSVDVHIIVPEQTNLLISLHNGPALFIPTTLRSLAAPRNSIGLTMIDKRKTSIVSPGAKCNIPSSYWMLYVIVDNIVDRFFNLVETCTNEVEQLDSLVLELPPREQTDLLLRIGESRKNISSLRLQLLRKQDIVHTLLIESKEASQQQQAVMVHENHPGGMAPSPSPSHPEPAPSPSAPLIAGKRVATIRIFLRDVLDHVNGMLYDLEQDKETLLNLTNAYQARVNIEMNIAATEQNKVMKKFSAMATIILPLTFVPSLWGMNVPVPGEAVKSLWPFWTITGSLVVLGIIASIIFWRIKWLD
jgi:magnesium transporter